MQCCRLSDRITSYLTTGLRPVSLTRREIAERRWLCQEDCHLGPHVLKLRGVRSPSWTMGARYCQRPHSRPANDRCSALTVMGHVGSSRSRIGHCSLIVERYVLTRLRESACRVGVDLHRPHPLETRQGRLSGLSLHLIKPPGRYLDEFLVCPSVAAARVEAAPRCSLEGSRDHSSPANRCG